MLIDFYKSVYKDAYLLLYYIHAATNERYINKKVLLVEQIISPYISPISPKSGTLSPPYLQWL
jgi:hypothetical protein